MSNSLNTMVNPQLDNSLLESLTSAVLRRINIAQIASMQGRAKSVNIDAVTFEDTNVEQVNIENLSTNIKCGAAILRNVRMILELHYKVNWSYDLKWLGSNSGIKELGSKAKPIPLHDIHIPALQDIALDIPQAEIEDIDAEIQPVTNFSLGGIGFEDLAINNTNLPSDGFSLSGMGFKSFKLDTFGVPASDSEDLTISQFTPDNRVSLPTISVSGINIPSVAIDDVVSDGAVSIMDIQPEEFEAPVFKIGEYFKAYFIVTPVLHFQIGELVLSDLKASASIGSVSVERASSGIVAKGIKLDGLILNELTVNQVKV
ncbi:hypothetical protein A1359_04345 [Methylomonas lenta]|uniref:Uncharacterized protein n=1 Tax=Methylomonas lenta TaxID=980561 RepID=A0A177NLT8_9GAMM|nr:hypothetical protein [Methylomonas lenta]OAI18802.1 hypothetical protein A1359_04345 [Methylomonas lenta]